MVCTTRSPSLFRRVVTVPMAAVLTSAHVPSTRCTIAPSTLTCWMAGPCGAAGNSRSSCADASSSSAVSAAPAASVWRRSVSSLIQTPQKNVSSPLASANGILLPCRAAASNRRGPRLPGTRPNS